MNLDIISRYLFYWALGPPDAVVDADEGDAVTEVRAPTAPPGGSRGAQDQGAASVDVKTLHHQHLTAT